MPDFIGPELPELEPAPDAPALEPVADAPTVQPTPDVVPPEPVTPTPEQAIQSAAASGGSSLGSAFRALAGHLTQGLRLRQGLDRDSRRRRSGGGDALPAEPDSVVRQLRHGEPGVLRVGTIEARDR